MEVKPSNFTGW